MTEILRDTFAEQPVADIGPDAYLDMMLRRYLSEIAEEPVYFYDEGMDVLLNSLPVDRPLTERDAVVDVGCSTGEFLIRAMRKKGVLAYGIGIDAQTDANANFCPADLDCSRFSFMLGRAEGTQLPRSAVRGLFAHNVMFRGDSLAMIKEYRRIVEPDGVIIMSTNFPDHAPLRHSSMEQMTAEFSTEYREELARRGIQLTVPRPPADGVYFEELKDMLSRDSGLEIIGEPVEQNTFAKITLEVLDVLEYSLMCSANYTGMPDDMRWYWRRKVEETVNMLREEIEKKQAAGAEPWFVETIHRGMIAVRNLKADPGEVALRGVMLD